MLAVQVCWQLVALIGEEHRKWHASEQLQLKVYRTVLLRHGGFNRGAVVLLHSMECELTEDRARVGHYTPAVRLWLRASCLRTPYCTLALLWSRCVCHHCHHCRDCHHCHPRLLTAVQACAVSDIELQHDDTFEVSLHEQPSQVCSVFHR